MIFLVLILTNVKIRFHSFVFSNTKIVKLAHIRMALEKIMQSV